MSEQQFTTTGPVRVDLKVAAGDFHISTIEDGQATVSLEGPPEALDALRVDLLQDRLVIEQRRKPSLSFLRHTAQPLHVEARVPHGSSIEIMTASGDATLEGTFAAVEMSSASGNVRAAGEIDGDARVKTVSGDARLPRVAGALTAHSVSGSIEAESVDGAISAKSVSGNVRVGSLHQGEVTVHSVSGDVELGIASGTSVDVDAGSASGKLSSEIPLSDAPGESPGATVVIRGSTVSGDFRVFRAA